MSGLSVPYVAALITVAAGLGLGFAALLILPRALLSRSAGDNQADLEERLQHFIAQLRDLDEQRGRLDEAAYTSQKAEFETRAAQVLKALKQPKDVRARAAAARDAIPVTPAVAFLSSHPQLRGAVWGGGTVGVLAFLYFLAVSEEHQAPATMGPGTRPPMAGAAAGGANADQAELKGLTDRLQANPDDVEALLRASHLLLKNQMLDECEVLNSRALKLSPQNPEGLVHQAVITAGRGDAAGAMGQLDLLLKRESTFAEGWFFRGMLSMQQGNQELMRESMTQFIRYAPDGPQKERIRAMLGGGAMPPAPGR